MIEQQDKTANQEEKISDYLQAPRKKRKHYVIMALQKNFDPELGAVMEGYVKKHYPGLSVSKPKDMVELTRQFGRNISLLIVADDFDNTEPGKMVEVIRALKEKRRTETIPVLFFTKNPKQLVADYHQFLLPYHETDDYLQYPNQNRQQIISRIKDGIESKNKRRGRRYKVNFDLSFFLLARDQSFKGQLVDMSIFGALIQAEDGCLFRVGDQLRLNIPIIGLLSSQDGDFLKVSAKVRRVFISGTLAGISFEHLSDTQQRKLTKILTKIVSRDMIKKSQAFHARAAAPGKTKR